MFRKGFLVDLREWLGIDLATSSDQKVNGIEEARHIRSLKAKGRGQRVLSAGTLRRSRLSW